MTDQPPPVPNDSTPIMELVLADLQARDKLGQARYGTRLQAHNGRDALRDAYEEAMDLTIYLRQVIEEAKTRMAADPGEDAAARFQTIIHTWEKIACDYHGRMEQLRETNAELLKTREALLRRGFALARDHADWMTAELALDKAVAELGKGHP